MHKSIIKEKQKQTKQKNNLLVPFPTKKGSEIAREIVKNLFYMYIIVNNTENQI